MDIEDIAGSMHLCGHQGKRRKRIRSESSKQNSNFRENPRYQFRSTFRCWLVDDSLSSNSLPNYKYGFSYMHSCLLFLCFLFSFNRTTSAAFLSPLHFSPTLQKHPSTCFLPSQHGQIVNINNSRSTTIKSRNRNRNRNRNRFPNLFATRKNRKSDYTNSPDVNARTNPTISQPTMDTSLCIVPPDDAWDDIQRARHLARDPTFYQFPPSIRLFHPFLQRSQLPEAAIDLAELVEKYQLEGFEITLNQIIILPHLELLEELENAQKTLPKQVVSPSLSSSGAGVDSDGYNGRDGLTEEERRTQALIDAEEQKGKKKLERRRAKELEKKRLMMEQLEQQQKQQQGGSTLSNNARNVTGNTDNIEHQHNDDDNEQMTTRNKDLSPKQLLKQQTKQKLEFNGPCIICLEPDDESKIQLLAFREVLRKKLFHEYDPFSVSSALTTTRTIPPLPLTSNPEEKKEIIGANVDNYHHHYSGLPTSVLKKHGLVPDSSSSDKETSSSSNKKGRKRSKKSSARSKKKGEGSTFRPVLTLGRFSTVTKAVKVARMLQQVWEPLTFQVSDLHFISRTSDNVKSSSALERKGGSGEDDDEDDEIANFRNMWSRNDGSRHNTNNGNNAAFGIQMNEDGAPVLSDNREYALRKLHGTDESESLLTTSGEYGCDALVMLKGEEGHSQNDDDDEHNSETTVDQSDLDKDEEEQILGLLLSDAGIPGGGDQREGGEIMESFENPAVLALGDEMNTQGESDDSTDEHNLEDWLRDDDDEWDEGATIVIGRTQFFLGEMRQYIGMPASSTMDGKDRILGDGVSGSARRRGAVHRQGDRYDDGDFGRKDKDYKA